ncbi:LamG domain-containing protein [Blastopirellula sp. J2-11]|uniref:LamG domain-containing protein n=1 Tax=Blastopirellula sp. J2-11 TaxID=2943192 RepID=UPI0021C6ECF5|nr:LamG domain-containing protein [Blastopirellula sp. J2-11]UUO06367.1 LamG domain-containing protein [Blastopirellula sp. J2-11]
MSSNSQKLESEARHAIDRLIDGSFSDEEFAALELRLLEDDAFRQAYVEQSDLEAELETRFNSLPVEWPRPAATPAYLKFSALVLAATVLLILTLLALVLLRSEPLATQPKPRLLEFAETRLSGLRPIAIVTKIEGAIEPETTALKPGDHMKPGVMNVEQGAVQIEFLSGAVVRLNGPAELHLLSDSSATLIYGQASAVVPPGVKTFTLNGPMSAIADNSSEFTYAIQSPNTCNIDVYQGELMTSLLGESGDTLLNELVRANETATFSGGKIHIAQGAFAQSNRTRVLPLDQASLSVSDAYAATIIADQPLVYWRFEQEDQQGDMIRNQMSDRYAGHLHASEPESLQLDHGSLDFNPSKQPRYLKLDEPIEHLNAGDFTVEFWVRPQRMHWGTIFGLLPLQQSEPDRESHLCVIEYANQTNLVHRPATIRFLFRYPPTTYQGGMNVFSAETCTPGMWHHLVAVRDSDGIRLYLNGKLREVSDNLMLDDLQPYTAVLGQLDSVRLERQFDGQIDEVAIYQKALSAAEVNQHYKVMSGNQAY